MSHSERCTRVDKLRAGDSDWNYFDGKHGGITKVTETRDAYLVFYPPGATGADKALIASSVLLLKNEHVESAKDERWMWLLLLVHFVGAVYVWLVRRALHAAEMKDRSEYILNAGEYWWLQVYFLTAIFLFVFLYLENVWKYGELCGPLKKLGNVKFFKGSQALLGHNVALRKSMRGSRVTNVM